MNVWQKNIGLLFFLVPAVACGGNSRASSRVKTVSRETSVAAPQAAPTPIDVEDDVLRLVEEGRVTDAQALAKRSNATGDKLVRLEGILYHGVGQPDSALPALTKAHNIAPNDPTMTLLLAEVLCWKKDFGAAKSLLESVPDVVIDATPRPWELGFHKAKILGWLGKVEDAETQYARVHNIKNVPERTRLRCQIGLAELTAWRKRYKQALQLVSLVLDESPGNVEALLLKGQVQEWQGHYKEARVTYSSALQANPNDAELQSRLEKLSWVK